jgi:hypothetical protein
MMMIADSRVMEARLLNSMVTTILRRKSKKTRRKRCLLSVSLRPVSLSHPRQLVVSRLHSNKRASQVAHLPERAM